MQLARPAAAAAADRRCPIGRVNRRRSRRRVCSPSAKVETLELLETSELFRLRGKRLLPQRRPGRAARLAQTRLSSDVSSRSTVGMGIPRVCVCSTRRRPAARGGARRRAAATKPFQLGIVQALFPRLASPERVRLDVQHFARFGPDHRRIAQVILPLLELVHLRTTAAPLVCRCTNCSDNASIASYVTGALLCMCSVRSVLNGSRVVRAATAFCASREIGLQLVHLARARVAPLHDGGRIILNVRVRHFRQREAVGWRGSHPDWSWPAPASAIPAERHVGLLPSWGQRAPAFRHGGMTQALLFSNIRARLDAFARAMNPCVMAFGQHTCTTCRVFGAFHWASRQRVKQARSSWMPQVSGSFGPQ